MKPNIRALLDRCIREGIDHAFLNTDVEIPDKSVIPLADEIDSRIWLYIDEYFTFTNND